jgi:uncharacterized Zn-finger protein
MQDWLVIYKPIEMSHPSINPLTPMANRVRRRVQPGRSREFGQTQENMTEAVVPHFHNTPGVAVIEIGAREFMCIGELPPFDHPHVFLDMGDAAEIICPYCSTLFRHDPSLGPRAARPAECMLPEDVIV